MTKNKLQTSFSCSHIFPSKCRLFGQNPSLWTQQGIIGYTGTETFAKEPKLAKLLWELKHTAV